MANDLNNVTLSGRLVKDIETRQAGQTQVGNFALAVGYKYGDKDETNFINCTAFGKTAEFLANYTGKGKRISIVGRIKQDTWEDQNGNKKSALGVVCNTVHIIDWKENGQSGQANQQNQQNNSGYQNVPVGDNNPFLDDDIPF